MVLAPPPTPSPFPPSFPPEEPAEAWDWVWSVLANIWSFLTSEAGALAALAAIVTAVIAVIALRSTSADSRERSRPVVYAWFRQAEHNDRAFDFVVRNYGPSAARDVTLKFEPDLTTEQKADRLVEIIAERWERTLPVLPPGAEIKNLWWTTRPGHSGGEKGAHNGLATPDQVTVTITYRGVGRKRYAEVIPLDGRWMKLDSSSVSSDSNRGRLTQIAKAMNTVATEQTKASRILSEIAETVTGEDDSDPKVGSYERIIEGFGGLMAPAGENRDGAVPETAPPPKTPANRPPASRRQRSTPKPKPKPPEEPKPESNEGP
ncbi:MAG: hypothetical protein ACJLS2_06210 [Microcella pacifica]